MTNIVRFLHLEDSEADCQLILATLEVAGMSAESRAAGTREEYIRALDEGGFDLILADCNLPSFDGLEALVLARGRHPETPFLFVSGFIGEEAALESLKHGATDYVFKHNLGRLAPAVRRALQEAREHREHRQAEAALQEREAMLASFFDAAPFMMGVIEVLPDDLLIISTNAASARYIQSTPETLLHRRVSELGWPPELLARWVEQCREALHLGQPVEREHQFLRDGQSRWFLSTINALPSDGPRPRCCYVTADITEKKLLEQQFLRAQRLESVGTLASGIAHDLNNVLAPILISLRVFRHNLSDPEALEVLASVEASARRGADIVRQVLTFARGDEGERQPLCVGRLVEDVAKILRDTFPRSIQIEADVTPGLGKVNGDATQLYQVLMNLCVNARDAMPDGGCLRLTARNTEAIATPGRSIIMSVADNGSGIAREILDKIFDPFFTTKEAGTGLGLATAQTIVKSHGGFITVRSEPGRGSEFQVRLPAHDKLVAAPAATMPAETPRGRGECILVVDDEASIRLTARAMLIEQGYQALTAADGREAMEIFDREGARVRLVLTDIMMSAMDGAALVKALHDRKPGVKVIAMSGLVDGRSLAERHSFRGAIFLPKPFTAEKLLETVAAAL